MARLEKSVQGTNAAKKEDLASFRNERKAGKGRLTRLAGRFILSSLIAVSPAFAGQHISHTKQSNEITDTESMFPALDRVSSFNEKGKDTEYLKEDVDMMRSVDAFIKRNKDNRAFMLIAEAIMNEVLNVQTEKGISYNIAYVDEDDKITIVDSLKHCRKKITMRQVRGGVEISVDTLSQDTEGVQRFSMILKQGELPSMENIGNLRVRLYTLFDDLFSTNLFMRAACGD